MRPVTAVAMKLATVLLSTVALSVAMDDDDTETADTSTMSDEKRLIKKLLKHYETVGVVGRPVLNQSQTIHVNYGLALIQILDLDEKNQVLTTNVWSRYTWSDVMLTWDPKLYGGVQQIRVPVGKIWKPDIVLYNYADSRLKEHRDAMAVVGYQGDVLWLPAAIFRSTCSVDIQYFPFDIQVCDLKFGSWTYDGWKLDVDFHSDVGAVIDTSNYVQSNEWKLLGCPAKKNIEHYPCCEEPFPDLTFTIVVKRIPIFYMIILITPCILLSLLTLVSFWLPPETPAKILLGMNIFLAFFLLLKLLASSTPSSSSIPLIGAFFCVNMVLITLSSFLSATVINLYMRTDKKNRVPVWLRKIAIEGLSKVLCMEQRKNVAKKKRRRRDHVTHHVTHVIDDGGANGGTRKSHVHVHAKTIKSPVLPYNKWEAQPNKGSARSESPIEMSDAVDPGLGSSYVVSDGTVHHTMQTICSSNGVFEAEIREIKRVLRSFMIKLQSRDAKEKLSLEWRLVALSIDRLFFVVYVTTIITSILVISLTCILYSDAAVPYHRLQQQEHLLSSDNESAGYP